MRLDHKKVENFICQKYNLIARKDGNFTRFFEKEDKNHNIGFIEKIKAGRFPKTLYIQFFDFSDNDRNIRTENDIVLAYMSQCKTHEIAGRDIANQSVNTSF